MKQVTKEQFYNSITIYNVHPPALDSLSRSLLHFPLSDQRAPKKKLSPVPGSKSNPRHWSDTHQGGLLGRGREQRFHLDRDSTNNHSTKETLSQWYPLASGQKVFLLDLRNLQRNMAYQIG